MTYGLPRLGSCCVLVDEGGIATLQDPEDNPYKSKYVAREMLEMAVARLTAWSPIASMNIFPKLYSPCCAACFLFLSWLPCLHQDQALCSNL